MITMKERIFLDSLGLGDDTIDILSGSIMVQPKGDGEHAIVRWIVEKEVEEIRVRCAISESEIETFTPKKRDS